MPHRLTYLADRALVTQLQIRGFVSRRIPTRSGSVHLLDAKGVGSLPPLVVLHGFSAAAHYYDGVLTRMRPYVRRVIAPDLLGHGFSEMPASGLSHSRMRTALLDAIDATVHEPVIVFGNSLGGAAALKLAVERPDLVCGLFLVAPGGAPMPSEELATFVDRFRLRSHEQALDFVDRLFARPPIFRHALAWGTRQQFARPGLRDLIESIGPEDLLQATDIGSLRMPIQVIWGAADRILHAAHLDFFRTHLPPQARIHVVEHFGHTPHMDHPDDLQRRLLAFCRQVESQETRADRPAGRDSLGFSQGSRLDSREGAP